MTRQSRKAPKAVHLEAHPRQHDGRVFTIWPARQDPDGTWVPGGNWRATESPFLVYDVSDPERWVRVGMGRTRALAIRIERAFRSAAAARRRLASTPSRQALARQLRGQEGK